MVLPPAKVLMESGGILVGKLNPSTLHRLLEELDSYDLSIDKKDIEPFSWSQENGSIVGERHKEGVL